MKKQLLFVTHQNEETDDGLAYAVDLARTMDEGITVLLVNRKNLMEKFERAMAAVTFAEANEHETSRAILAEGEQGDEDAGKRVETLLDKCRDLGVNITVHAVTEDAVTAVKDYLKKRNGVDMVLLSPSVTDKKNLSARELQRLVKTASRPIVTMARQGIGVSQEPCYDAH